MAGKLVELNETNFKAEVLDSPLPVLVDFWATWCGPCMAIGPTMEKLSEEYAGRLKVAKVNVDKEPGLAMKYGITSIPAVLLFKGGKLQDTTIGSRHKADFETFVKRHL
jgi:thioredoxin 1